MKLFQQHHEHCPLTIVVLPESQKDNNSFYSDVLDDPESVPQTLNLLKTMNLLLANLLIDYFEVHTWSMLLLGYIMYL